MAKLLIYRKNLTFIQKHGILICNLLDRNVTTATRQCPILTSDMVCGKLQVRPCPTSLLSVAFM